MEVIDLSLEDMEKGSTKPKGTPPKDDKHRPTDGIHWPRKGKDREMRRQERKGYP